MSVSKKHMVVTIMHNKTACKLGELVQCVAVGQYYQGHRGAKDVENCTQTPRFKSQVDLTASKIS